MKEVLDELTRWGKKGYAVSLRYGVAPGEGDYWRIGWVCGIESSSVGTVITLGGPLSYHPTDPIEAARGALKQAATRWPAMVEGM